MSEFDNSPIGMSETPIPPQTPVSGNEQVMAIASIVLGAIGLCSSLVVGLCGAPFSIIGLVLGYLAMKDPNQKTLAIIGMVLSGLSLLLMCLLIFIAGGLTILGPAVEGVFNSVNQSLQTAP